MKEKELEKEYYPLVEKWLKKSHHCFKTAINTGKQFSRADIIGVRDTGGDFSGEIETIVIEVKRGTQAFATASGQAYSYIVYANRVYLADKKVNGFTQEEIQIANHIGIGLILIDKNNKCHEVLSSPYYKPMTKANTALLVTLKLAMCQICHCYVETGESDSKSRFNKLMKEDLHKAFTNEKGIIFWNYTVANRKVKNSTRFGRKYKEDFTFERRIICNDCVKMLSTINPNE